MNIRLQRLLGAVLLLWAVSLIVSMYRVSDGDDVNTVANLHEETKKLPHRQETNDVVRPRPVPDPLPKVPDSRRPTEDERPNPMPRPEEPRRPVDDDRPAKPQPEPKRPDDDERPGRRRPSKPDEDKPRRRPPTDDNKPKPVEPVIVAPVDDETPSPNTPRVYKKKPESCTHGYFFESHSPPTHKQITGVPTGIATLAGPKVAKIQDCQQDPDRDFNLHPIVVVAGLYGINGGPPSKHEDCPVPCLYTSSASYGDQYVLLLCACVWLFFICYCNSLTAPMHT